MIDDGDYDTYEYVAGYGSGTPTGLLSGSGFGKGFGYTTGSGYGDSFFGDGAGGGKDQGNGGVGNDFSHHIVRLVLDDTVVNMLAWRWL